MNDNEVTQVPPAPPATAIARAVPIRSTRRRIILLLSALAAALLVLTIIGPAPAQAASKHPASSKHSSSLVVKTHDGSVRGVLGDGVREFRGVPYAAAPTGALRWKPPQPVEKWRGVRDASTYSPICPQGPTSPYGSSEDCLYLNVTAPTDAKKGRYPVIVWLHGGGYQTGTGSDYDADKLAAAGAVVVTINYRLGLLGFLAHPALESHGTAGNYGLMDQQAALRWVKKNIAAFGGNAHNVTIAGQSAGGLAALQLMLSPGAKGLFTKAIIESGAFAPVQKSLAAAEAEGVATATALGCDDQTAKCLRRVPVEDLVANQPLSITPGMIDGKVVKMSLRDAFAKGRFAKIPILNGTTTSEERIFTGVGLSIQNGATVPLAGSNPVTAANYVDTIASAFSVSPRVAKRIAHEYPVRDYATANHAFNAAASDANFACPAYELDAVASKRTTVFGYEFNDANAPWRDVPDFLGEPRAASHGAEQQYLFDLPNAAFPGELSGEQQELAGTMRAAWTRFAASGSPATHDQPWPQFQHRKQKMLSLTTPASEVFGDFAAAHHCGFWEGVDTNTRW